MLIKKWIFLFCLIALIKSKTIRFMTIPFTIDDFVYKDDTNPLFNSFLYKDVRTTISIGNPKQELPISIGMGEYATYILSENTQGFEGGIFAKEVSSTFKTSQKIEDLYHYQTFNEAFQAVDNIQLQSPYVKIGYFEFLLVTRVGDNICYLPYCEVLTQPGVLGLRMAKSESNNEIVNNTNFITQMKNKRIIDDFDFTFFYEEPNRGHLIIGKKPEEYDPEHYIRDSYVFTHSTSELKNEKDWGLNVNKIMYGEEEMTTHNVMLLRFEYGVINGHYQWQKILEDNFFNELIEAGKCFKEKGWNDGHNYYHYHCNKNTNLEGFKPLTFIIDDLHYNLTLTYEDLFVEKDDFIYFLMIFGHPNIILGQPIFKKYQFVFNQKTQTIGLYMTIYDNRTLPIPEPLFFAASSKLKTYRAIIFILVIIIIVLVALILIHYLKTISTRPRKKAMSLLDKNNKSEIQLSDFSKVEN